MTFNDNFPIAQYILPGYCQQNQHIMTFNDNFPIAHYALPWYCQQNQHIMTFHDNFPIAQHTLPWYCQQNQHIMATSSLSNILMSILFSRNVDIKFSAHNAFLE